MDLRHLAWPFFEPRHRALAETFRRWASEHLTAFENDEGGDGKAARKIFQLLGEGGWLEHTLPAHDRSKGSPRFDLRSVCLLREISAYGSAIADVALSEPWLGILPIALAASDEIKADYLPGYGAGSLLPAFALSEPGAGSDAAAITTRARRVGNHFEIDGQKKWTSNSGLADLYVVFAQSENGGRPGISAFAVDGREKGIRLEERLTVLPPHTVGTWRLQNCRVAPDRVIGEAGEGFKTAMAALEIFRPTVGAAALGFARRAFDEAKAHSLKRTAFKKPIAEHQLIQAKLADMAVKIDAAALLVYRAAWQYDAAAGPIGREAAVAKLYATEAAFEVIDQAVQIHGGLGVTRGSAVERLFRHSRAFRIFDGTSEIQQLIIARDLLR